MTSERIPNAMKCRLCGSRFQLMVTDLPFKVADSTIVILKSLPVLQCENCQEYLIADKVMERVDVILDGASTEAELEVVRFAA